MSAQNAHSEPSPDPRIHEAGWLTKGWRPKNRRYQMHCNTCGATGRWTRSIAIVQAHASAHALNPDRRRLVV